MMRPKSAMFYVDQLQEIGDEFVSFIRRERDSNPDRLIPDLLLPCHRFALESITAIALDTRLGCLDPEIPPGISQYFKKPLVQVFHQSYFPNLSSLNFITKLWPDDEFLVKISVVRKEFERSLV